MAIEKMKLIQISGNISCLDDVLMRCSLNGSFHPELPPLAGNRGFQKMDDIQNPYTERRNAVEETAILAGISLEKQTLSGSDEILSPDGMAQFLDAFQKRLRLLTKKKAEMQTTIEQEQAALHQLKHLETLDVNLDQLFACKYMKIRFGRLPVDSYKKLGYYKDRMFFFLSISEEDGYHWGIYLTTKQHEVEIDDLFSSLYFERIFIPDYVHGTPDAAKKTLEEKLAKDQKDQRQIEEKIVELVQNNKAVFLKIYGHIRFLEETFALRRYVAAYQDQFRLIGFLPERETPAFRKNLQDLKGVALEIQPYDSDKRLHPPTKLKNNRLFQPFEMFVSMYGLPSYQEIDPTPILGMTYMLLFGLMFGDLGQGLVIALVGALLWRFKKMMLGKIMVRIGFSAALFGLVYGSVFGLEHALDPLYTNLLGLSGKPVEIMNPLTINNLLLFAIGLGIVLIVLSMCINIAVGLKNRDFEKAIFSENGVAGLVFYGGILAGVLSMVAGGANLFTLPYILGVIVLPILVVFLKGPLGRMAKGEGKFRLGTTVGSYILEGFFELFEVVLSFITNTMSFLRVGGFIISHAGMMAVVITLTEMFTGVGSIIVMIFGNAFVMCLEGFIVGIQTLRLEFYEMFSRYFSGQGSEYRPITLGRES